MRREQLLDGRFIVSEQIIKLVGKQFRSKIERMCDSLWANFLKNQGSTAGTYWMNEFNDDIAYNRAIKHLSRSGWITSIVDATRNWSELSINKSKVLEYIDDVELENVRRYNKFNDKKMSDECDVTANRTKLGKDICDTGITRQGIANMSSSMFKYDCEMIEKYQDVIELNVTKSMRELKKKYGEFSDDINYEEISKEVVQYHMFSDKEFCLESNTNDSRGRAIAGCLSKVFNPIGFKDARSLIVIPEDIRVHLNYKAISDVYLFIAELAGIKTTSMTAKIKAGRECYDSYFMHDLDYSIESDRNDAHENIWLERIYADLDAHFGSKNHKWSVPIELDATASMIQIEGALLNHKPFLDKTNVVGSVLKDIWTIDGLGRNQVKKAMTPMLYGSSRTAKELWKKNKIKYTANDVSIFNKEITRGDLSVAAMFKDFIIDEVKPSENMTVNIWDEEFNITCNRYRNVGEYAKQYNIYDTASDSIKTIYHTHTTRVADLDSFKRYFVTLLVHNLDGRVADYVCLGLDWGIPIYDAFIVCPSNASIVRSRYGSQLEAISNNRDSILDNYFKSIGISRKNNKAWNKLSKAIKPLDGPLKVQRMALK